METTKASLSDLLAAERTLSGLDSHRPSFDGLLRVACFPNEARSTASFESRWKPLRLKWFHESKRLVTRQSMTCGDSQVTTLWVFASRVAKGIFNPLNPVAVSVPA